MGTSGEESVRSHYERVCRDLNLDQESMDAAWSCYREISANYLLEVRIHWGALSRWPCVCVYRRLSIRIFPKSASLRPTVALSGLAAGPRVKWPRQPYTCRRLFGGRGNVQV